MDTSSNTIPRVNKEIFGWAGLLLIFVAMGAIILCIILLKCSGGNAGLFALGMIAAFFSIVFLLIADFISVEELKIIFNTLSKLPGNFRGDQA